MRWIWIDRFESFELNVAAVAVKNVSLAEDHLHDHFPGFPVMPASLMIEGMAQTAGILVGARAAIQRKSHPRKNQQGHLRPPGPAR